MHALSFDSIIVAEKEALTLLQEHGIVLIPGIILFTDIDQSKVQLGMANLSKVFSVPNLVKHSSGIWFVGAEGRIRKLAEVLNTMFLGGRAVFVATIDEAKVAAEKNKTVDTPLLEQ